MPEGISTTPLLMAPGEFERRMSMARMVGKPLEYIPRGLENFAGLAINPQALMHDGSSSDDAKELFIRSGRTAIISVDGPIFFAASFFSWLFGGMTNPMIVRALHNAAEDDSIDRIVMDYHCPGGDVAGMDDLISAINAAKSSKPVIAMVHDMAASAAYWMASQCSWIVASPSSTIGSIGAISVYYDDSQWADKHGVRPVVITDAPHKSMGHYAVPIDDQMIERETKLVTDMSQGFRVAVSEARGIEVDELKAMGGSMHYAPDALSRGLCDEIRSTADFYQAVEAGEYDSYGSVDRAADESGGQPATTKNNTPTSGRAVAQHTENRTMNVDETYDAMTEGEKEEMRAKLAETEGGDDENNEDDNAGATSEGGDEDENAGATTDGGTDDKEEKASANLSIPEIKSIISDMGLPKSMATEMTLEAVEKGYSETTLMRKCNKALRSDDSQLERDAQGSSKPIGGGAGSLNSSGGSAKAEVQKRAEALIEKNPKLSMSQAKAKVYRNDPALQERFLSESNKG